MVITGLAEQRTMTQRMWDRMLRVGEQVASCPLGQNLFRIFHQVLWIVETSICWFMKPEELVEKDPSSLTTPQQPVRPLPWILFIPVLACLRMIKFIVELVASIRGKDPIRPVQVVRFLQIRRRRLRAIKYQGLKNFRSWQREEDMASKAEGQCLLMKVFSMGPVAKLIAFTGLGRIMSILCGTISPFPKYGNKAKRDDSESSDDNEGIIEKINRICQNFSSDEDPDYEPNEKEESDDYPSSDSNETRETSDQIETTENEAHQAMAATTEEGAKSPMGVMAEYNRGDGEPQNLKISPDIAANSNHQTAETLSNNKEDSHKQPITTISESDYAKPQAIFFSPDAEYVKFKVMEMTRDNEVAEPQNTNISSTVAADSNRQTVETISNNAKDSQQRPIITISECDVMNTQAIALSSDIDVKSQAIEITPVIEDSYSGAVTIPPDVKDLNYLATASTSGSKDENSLLTVMEGGTGNSKPETFAAVQYVAEESKHQIDATTSDTAMGRSQVAETETESNNLDVTSDVDKTLGTSLEENEEMDDSSSTLSLESTEACSDATSQVYYSAISSSSVTPDPQFNESASPGIVQELLPQESDNFKSVQIPSLPESTGSMRIQELPTEEYGHAMAVQDPSFVGSAQNVSTLSGASKNSSTDVNSSKQISSLEASLSTSQKSSLSESASSLTEEDSTKGKNRFISFFQIKKKPQSRKT